MNAVGRMLGVLGDEWTLLIAQQALLGTTRYGDFAERLPISHAVLSNRLATMTDGDLLERLEYRSRPTRYDYAPTARGRSLWPVLTSIWEWERRWVPDHAERLPGMTHLGCGAPFAPVVGQRSGWGTELIGEVVEPRRAERRQTGPTRRHTHSRRGAIRRAWPEGCCAPTTTRRRGSSRRRCRAWTRRGGSGGSAGRHRAWRPTARWPAGWCD